MENKSFTPDNVSEFSKENLHIYKNFTLIYFTS